MSVLPIPSLVPPELVPPAVGRTSAGVAFDTGGSVWAIRDGVRRLRFDFGLLPECAPRLSALVKSYVLWRIENTSPLGALTAFRELKQGLTALHEVMGQPLPGQLNRGQVLSLNALLQGKADRLAHCLSALRKMEELGFQPVDEQARLVLNELTLPNRPKNIPVLTLDAKDGPFSPLELEGLCAALNRAYAERCIPQDLFTLAWLYLATGARPVQLAALKVKDLQVTVEGDGFVRYILSVPRAKQKNSGGNPRASFKQRELIEQVGALVSAQAEAARARFEGQLSDTSEAPLFPGAETVDMAPGFEGHTAVDSMNRRFNALWKRLEVLSERTRQAMTISAVRFRRTLGTRAAQEGQSIHTIAELLDHSSLDSAKAYVANVPDIAQRLDRELAEHLAPLAQAFAGKLISDEADASRGTDPTSRILDLRVDQKAPVGSCGQHSFCGFAAPVACYTCSSFEPWVDGPHDKVLERLLARRERLLKTVDARIAAINDRTILAVTQVVQLCKAQQSALPKDGVQ